MKTRINALAILFTLIALYLLVATAYQLGRHHPARTDGRFLLDSGTAAIGTLHWECTPVPPNPQEITCVAWSYYV